MRPELLTSLCVAGLAVAAPAFATNLMKDGGFELPATAANSYILYSNGLKLGPWTVVGASGNVATVSGTFSQGGFTFPAKGGKAWLDLTGVSNTATGVAQTIKTVVGTNYTITFWIGNIVNPGGIFGTTSTVNVYDGTTLIASPTNSYGAGSTKQVWHKYTASFTAAASTTTLSFINGDPSNDTNNGLDSVMVAPTVLAKTGR